MQKRAGHLVTATQLFKERYFDADCFLLCGSTVRGDATDSSDLDIVVVYKALDFAKRESFLYNNWPVEVFVHDLETLNYFFEKDNLESGVPSLAQMVNEGVILSNDNKITRKAKALAKNLLDKGPNRPSALSLEMLRYAITDLVDDIKTPRNDYELIASASKLLELTTDFIFKTNHTWSGKGKWIPRRLKKLNPELERETFECFNELFTDKDPKSVIELCEKILKPYGGFLFDNYSLDAPTDWRLKLES